MRRLSIWLLSCLGVALAVPACAEVPVIDTAPLETMAGNICQGFLQVFYAIIPYGMNVWMIVAGVLLVVGILFSALGRFKS